MATTIEQAVIDDLKTQTTVTAYVGSRIYYLEMDDEAPAGDYIVIRNPSHPRRPFSQGAMKSGQARLQFNCWSSNKWTAKAIAEAVADVYRERGGTIQSISISNISVQDARPLPGADEFLYTCDVIFDYVEP